MPDTPGFDPYQILGVGVDADEVVIQLAYRARMREAHPDVAGPAGLEAAKRLNMARDWLLDSSLRASRSGTHAAPERPGRWTARRRRAGRRTAWGPGTQDRHAAGAGARAEELRAFVRSIASLSADERARLNHSLGESRPVDLGRYRDYLGPELSTRADALRAAVEEAWRQGQDEPAPFVPRLGRILPSGFLVANAYAQWVLLQDFFREALAGVVVRGERTLESLEARCVGPWQGSVGQPRYGPYQPLVLDFLRVANALAPDAAERLARSWRHHMGRDGRGHPSEHIGPGVWLPAPSNVPDVLKISGYLAAVDASRIEPPRGLAERHHAGFRFGLRLTAHVLASGLRHDRSRDYLRPWREAVDHGAGAWSQPGWTMPTG